MLQKLGKRLHKKKTPQMANKHITKCLISLPQQATTTVTRMAKVRKTHSQAVERIMGTTLASCRDCKWTTCFAQSPPADMLISPAQKFHSWEYIQGNVWHVPWGIWMRTFTVALFATAKNRERAKCPSTEQIHWCTCSVHCYEAIQLWKRMQ